MAPTKRKTPSKKAKCASSTATRSAAPFTPVSGPARPVKESSVPVQALLQPEKDSLPTDYDVFADFDANAWEGTPIDDPWPNESPVPMTLTRIHQVQHGLEKDWLPNAWTAEFYLNKKVFVQVHAFLRCI
jgi:hypothetical protein